VVETAVTKARLGAPTLLLGAAMTALLALLALTGKPPGGQILERFDPHGIVAASPSDITRIEISRDKERLSLRREPSGSWAFDGADAAAASSELAAHLEMALRFMHVSTPTRTLDPGESGGAALADFGLDPPAFVVSLGGADQSVTTADFGALNPSGTAQYARLLGRPALYLLPRHVGAEWQLAADLARRSAPGEGHRAPPLLLASIDRIWTVEIVFAGKLYRFERDGAGDWFLHVGEHSHAAGAPAHVTDPAKAPIIRAALAAFGETTIKAVVAPGPDDAESARFGLELPPLLVLLYARDSSTPLERIEIGGSADDGFGRYARQGPDGDVVTIAADAPQRLVELLHAVGAAP
jgi:hypothetical protein